MKTQGIALILAGLLAGCGGNTGDSSTGHGTGAQSKQSGSASDRAMASVKGSVPADYQQVVQQLYIAYFGRPADPGGLANFQASLLAAGAHTDVPGLNADYSTNAAVKTLVDSFGASAESLALYGNSSTTSFISAIYKNVLGRTPPADDEGLAFWSAEVTSGRLSRGNAALSIAAGAMSNTSAQGKLDAQLIANRLTVAIQFTTTMALPASSGTYSGDAAAASARAILGGVSATTNTTTYMQSGPLATLWPDVVVPGLFHGVSELSKNVATTSTNGNGSTTIFNMPGGASWMLWGTAGSTEGIYQGGWVYSGGPLVVQGVAVGSLAPYGLGKYYGEMTQFAAPGNVPIQVRSSGLGFPSNSTDHLLGHIGNTAFLTPTTTFIDRGDAARYSMYKTPNASYNIDTPANLGSVSASWSGSLLDGGTANITIGADGAISGTTALGCALTGTARTSANGKNYYDVSIRYGAAPCSTPNQTETGIAFIYALYSGAARSSLVDRKFVYTYTGLSGQQQLILLATNATKTHATAFYAHR